MCVCLSLFLSLASTSGSYVYCVLVVRVYVWMWPGVGYGVSGEFSQYYSTRGWGRLKTRFPFNRSSPDHSTFVTCLDLFRFSRWFAKILCSWFWFISFTRCWFVLSEEVDPLFLASTVSAMHRNAHIWNASHPLVVTYYCWVTVYSPSMKAKNKKAHVRRRESNNQFPSVETSVRPLC